jgi:hypothetical protein
MKSKVVSALSRRELAQSERVVKPEDLAEDAGSGLLVSGRDDVMVQDTHVATPR